MSEPPPLKRENVRRQVLLALALGVVLALVLAGSIAARHGLFSRHAEIYFLADSGAGISPGISVRISGFRVGAVSAVELQPDLKVRVTMQIDEERFAALRADAHAEWFKEQLQAAVIDLDPGHAKEPLSSAECFQVANMRPQDALRSIAPGQGGLLVSAQGDERATGGQFQ